MLAGLLRPQLAELVLDLFDLLVRQLLEVDELRPRLVEASDQLVELQLDRARVPVSACTWSRSTSRNAASDDTVSGHRTQPPDQPKAGPVASQTAVATTA